jgi:YesN/AraC family two-component response regulator
VLSGYQLVINAQPDLEVTGTSASVAEALTAIQRTEPDLIITDLTMPGRGGLELVKDLMSVSPEATWW